MTTGTRKPGEFCWINMLTPQPTEACRFFGKLLGWTYAEMPANMRYVVMAGGRNIGGLFDVVSLRTPEGTASEIGVMVKVDSADAAGRAATSVGGKSEPAFDIMESGRMAVCTDPNGAHFDVWEPKKMLGTDADSSEHGSPSWFETLTTDVDRAAGFYSGLFGWTPEVMPMPDLKYTTFKHGTEYVAGMLQITPQVGGMRPHWATYFTVKDANETARYAVELGATLCVPVMEVPGVGSFCGLMSPQGVAFDAITYAR